MTRLQVTEAQLRQWQRNLGSSVDVAQEGAVPDYKPRKRAKQYTDTKKAATGRSRQSAVVEWLVGVWQGRQHYYRRGDENSLITACCQESHQRRYVIGDEAPVCGKCSEYMVSGRWKECV